MTMKKKPGPAAPGVEGLTADRIIVDDPLDPDGPPPDRESVERFHDSLKGRLSAPSGPTLAAATSTPMVKRPGCSRSEIDTIRNYADKHRRAVPAVAVTLDAGIVNRLAIAAELAWRHTDRLLSALPELESARASLETQGKRLAAHEKRIGSLTADRDRLSGALKALIEIDRRSSMGIVPPIMKTVFGVVRGALGYFSAERSAAAAEGQTMARRRESMLDELQNMAGVDDEGDH